MQTKEFIKNNNVKLRSITNLIGGVLMFVTGLYFVLFIDLNFKTQGSSSTQVFTLSAYLLVAILLAVGSGIIYFVGDSLKHKARATIILKGISIVLAIAFIVFLFYFKVKMNDKDTRVLESVLPTINSIITISLVIDIVGIVFLIINYILSIIFVKEDY